MYGWISYITAVALTHLITIARFMRTADPNQHPSFRKALLDFYVGDKTATYTSVVSIGVVWVLGSCLIDHVGVEYFPSLEKIPQHPAWTFLFGSLGEYITPRVVRTIIGLLPGGQ